LNFLLIRASDFQKQHEIGIFGTATMSHPPLGLLNIGAILEQNGHNVEIIDFYSDTDPLSRLKNSVNSSDVVGISVYSEECKSAIDICTKIKEIDENIPLIIGGPHCIFSKNGSLYSFPKADISVAGEGEYVSLDIAKYLEGTQNLSEIPGIFYREKNSIKSGKPIEVIKNLDDLPFPARHLVEKYTYGVYSFGYKLRQKVTSIITSRGCPFHCKFCARYGNSIKDWGFRTRSSENVFREIQEISEKYKSLWIVDDNFLADKKRAIKICDMIIDSGINIDLYIEGARVDSANEELYKKLKKAGTKLLGFGIESMNQDILDFYNKKITIQQIENSLHLANKMDFLTYGSFILGAPIETKEHIEKTIKSACKLPLDFANFEPLFYRRGSQLWDEAVKDKKITSDVEYFFADSQKGFGNFTRQELFEFKKKAIKRFYLRFNFLFRHLSKSFTRRDFSLLLNGSRFLFRLKNIDYQN
jgi:magnesium-protoporphyrin IX monomethyl ester (oxidative) cyclase